MTGAITMAPLVQMTGAMQWQWLGWCNDNGNGLAGAMTMAMACATTTSTISATTTSTISTNTTTLISANTTLLSALPPQLHSALTPLLLSALPPQLKSALTPLLLSELTPQLHSALTPLLLSELTPQLKSAATTSTISTTTSIRTTTVNTSHFYLLLLPCNRSTSTTYTAVTLTIIIYVKHMNLLVKLFSTIKEDDYRFYRNFFNIENDYFTSPNHILQASIASKRLQVFKLFVTEFNYKPTKKDLLNAIVSGSNKFIKYILELNSPDAVLFDRKIVDTDFKDFHSRGFGKNYPTKKDRFFKGFLCYLNIIKVDHNNRDQYYQLLIGTSIHNPYLDNCFEINEKSTLKTLITTAKLILKLKTPQPSQLSPSLDLKVKEEEEQIKEEEEEGKKEKFFPKVIKNIKAVETIEEIDNFIKKIDKVNLKSFLDNPINFSNSDNNEIKNFIKKLLKLYYSNFDTKVSIILYFCYYHEESNDDDYKTIFPSTDHLIKTAFRFGNYEILDPNGPTRCQTFLPGIGEFYNYDSYHQYKVLFSHCFNKEKKIKFIDQIIQRTIEQPEPGFRNYFLYMLVIHNDIELVKYYSNKVGNHIQVYLIREIIPPTYYIESKEMLEYLFYNQFYYFRDVNFYGHKSSYYRNLELLKHFELLLEKSKSVKQLGDGDGYG
ncbi:hypothetical protein ACTFIR_012074 [Dictyostelium discoideum]